MTLKVTPSDLDGYARQIGRAAGDATEFKSHCNKYTGIEVSDQGLLNLFLTTHTATVQTVNSALDRLQEVLSGASSELRLSKAYYEKTDRAVAARVDATYPVVKRPAE
ncbi:type VII secretion target [Streptomyces sp. NPDC050095]|uniref:type VII secretion target n=1 Tax=unclassified Streptomyces TaxID=2593676 RepID=UPI00341726C2